MRLTYRLAVIASAVALAASLGLAFAGPSGAVVAAPSRAAVPLVDDDYLCASTPDGTLCANDASPVTLGGGHAWDYPTSGHGQITVYNTSSSMTVNTSTYAVTLSSSAGASDQEFYPTSLGGGEYEFENDLTGRCLNAKYTASTVNVAPCNGGEDQVWFN